MDGSCIRLRPERTNHVWSYDFVEARTHDGRKFRMLNLIDEFTRECLAIRIDRKLQSIDVIDVLSDLFILRGVPGHIRSDNGPEFVAKAVRDWIATTGAKTAYIEPGTLGERLFRELQSRLRDELLNGEIFYSVAGGEDHHRELAPSLQRRSAACLSRLQTTSTRGLRACAIRVAGCATPTGSAGHAGVNASSQLTFQLDHSMQAGQV